jgi:hypothetical protein
MPGPTLITDGSLSPTVNLQQLSALIWFLPLTSANFSGTPAGSVNSECNAICFGPVSAASPGRRNRRLGTRSSLSFAAGEWFRTLSPIEPAIVRMMSFSVQKTIQGAELVGALARYF